MNDSVQDILTTAYFPPVRYFQVLAGGNPVLIEACETFQKQSYRNRCVILAANGPLSLTVPVQKGMGKPIRDVQIDYSRPWLQQHERALISAYHSSPFFEYYVDDLFPILDAKEKYLFDLNLRLMRKLISLVGLEDRISFTDSYQSGYIGEVRDHRDEIHPKKKGHLLPVSLSIPYYQVFAEKFGFVPELSVLDLLFNEGPDSISYL